MLKSSVRERFNCPRVGIASNFVRQVTSGVQNEPSRCQNTNGQNCFRRRCCKALDFRRRGPHPWLNRRQFHSEKAHTSLAPAAARFLHTEPIQHLYGQAEVERDPPFRFDRFGSDSILGTQVAGTVTLSQRIDPAVAYGGAGHAIARVQNCRNSAAIPALDTLCKLRSSRTRSPS